MILGNYEQFWKNLFFTLENANTYYENYELHVDQMFDKLCMADTMHGAAEMMHSVANMMHVRCGG